MRLKGFAFFFFITCSSLAADLLPNEEDLFHLMLNQNDPVFIGAGLVPNNDGSSLCGPASAINLYQLTEAPLTKSEQQQLLIKTSAAVRNRGIDVTQGLIEPQLIEFLHSASKIQNRNAVYHGKGRYFKDAHLALEDLLSNQPQILLLKYESRPRTMSTPERGHPSRGRPAPVHSKSFDAIRGFHFVLKVSADINSQEITFIDPENPGRYSKARIDLRTSPETTKADLRLLPSSSEDLRYFQTGPRLSWSVLSLIEKRN